MEVVLPEPVYYSVNGGEKQEVSLYDPDDPQAHPYTTIDVKVGDKVQLFSRNTTLSKDRDNNNGFYISFESECYVYGNVMSLISPDDNWKDNRVIKEPYALEMLFCYTNIVTHPTRHLRLPATKLSKGCYVGMFNSSAITDAPELPATQLAESCYEAMFSYCDDLTEATALPATQLEKRCYAYMFSHCGNLTSAIELPAEELPERCYSSMFFKCFKLSSVKCLATTMTGDFALMSWLKYAGTDESVSTRTLTHAPETPWVNSDEDQATTDDWFTPTDWTLVSL